LEDEPAEVKSYRSLFQEGELPRPECRRPECRVQRRGFRERTDVRLKDGSVLQAIPVPRFRCVEHGEVPFPLPFLAGRKRYLSSVVEGVLEGFTCLGRALERLVEGDGPDVRTVRRWVRPLTETAVQGWIREKLEAWGGSGVLAVPPRARPGVWETFQRLKELAGNLSREGWPVSPCALLTQAAQDST
jgi:hypothetical protein